MRPYLPFVHQLAMKMIQPSSEHGEHDRDQPELAVQLAVKKRTASSEQREEPSATCARVGSSRCRNLMQSSERGELERDLPSSRCSISKQTSEGRDQATATTGSAAIRRKWRSSLEEERARGRPVPAAPKLLRG
ncbi:hypothetical protein ACOSQ4_014192 [Xanthoceras sorbifolium]